MRITIRKLRTFLGNECRKFKLGESLEKIIVGELGTPTLFLEDSNTGEVRFIDLANCDSDGEPVDIKANRTLTLN